MELNTLGDDLMESYRRTSFCAATPRGSLCLRVGKPDQELDALLAAERAQSWAYLTAWNPGSIRLTEEENVLRQHALEQTLRKDGFAFFPGEGVGDDGCWPPEPSVLVLGITCAGALTLGRRFGQHAIVYGEAGGPPQLLRCEDVEGRRHSGCVFDAAGKSQRSHGSRSPPRPLQGRSAER